MAEQQQRRPTNPTGSGGGAAAFPPPKSQQYSRHPYSRPRPAPAKSKRRRRASCCCILFWLLVALLALAFLAAAAGGIFYLIYRPVRPDFTVTTARLRTPLNVSSSNAITSSIFLAVAAENKNKKLGFSYDDFVVSVSSPVGGGTGLGSGSVAGFDAGAGDVTVMNATVSSDGTDGVDPTAAAALKKAAAGGSMAIVVDMETKAGVQVGNVKTAKIGISVHCEGIDAAAPVKQKPKQKKAAAAAAAPAPDTDAAAAAAGDEVGAVKVQCDVRVKVKIWKWTL